MTSALWTSSSDLPTFLLGPGGLDNLAEVLDRAGVREQLTDAAATLTVATRAAVHRRLADAVRPLLDLDLSSVAVKGWSTARKVRDAARETRLDPDRTDFVELSKHTISTTRSPRADLLVGGRVVAHVELEMKVSLEVECLTATVARGRLLALQAGRCEAAVSLSAAGTLLAERRAPVDLQVSVALGDGLPLDIGTTSSPPEVPRPRPSRTEAAGGAGAPPPASSPRWTAAPSE